MRIVCVCVCVSSQGVGGNVVTGARPGYGRRDTIQTAATGRQYDIYISYHIYICVCYRIKTVALSSHTCVCIRVWVIIITQRERVYFVQRHARACCVSVCAPGRLPNTDIPVTVRDNVVNKKKKKKREGWRERAFVCMVHRSARARFH